MDLAACPHITTGVALASAAVIAAGPMAQHPPNLHLAQHLPQVSVSDINLTDTADSAIDLFAGVENELGTLANGASAAAVPASALTDVFSPITQNLVVQTWINTFQNAGTNLQYIYNTSWGGIPAPVLQQVAANWLAYANLYVGSYQTAASAGVKYFTGTTPGLFQPTIQAMLTAFQAGNFPSAFTDLYQAFIFLPFEASGLPLEKILNIPADITTNLAAATKYMTTTGVTLLGLYVLNLVSEPFHALGNSLQAVNDFWAAGNPLAALTNLANVPGAVANSLLNGVGGTDGLLSHPLGLLSIAANTMSPGLAKAIVAPNAANIASGGGLSTAFQGFANQLINGWPSLAPVVNDLGAGLTHLLQSIPSVVSNLPSILSNFGGVLASDMGLLISNLLKLL
ncbi:hypothetical protein [Mycobacterium malmoense]|uniref:hypothetical protein n=1 Tax=Mycobacterium malmoense TaxID=1780 RepID=UPI00114D4BF5|nr:hypothetical protein [Mycobacterium malmoense]